jgi:hypothetical protein
VIVFDHTSSVLLKDKSHPDQRKQGEAYDEKRDADRALHYDAGDDGHVRGRSEAARRYRRLQARPEAEPCVQPRRAADQVHGRGSQARILEKTNGAIEIQVFPQAQLPAYKEGVEQVVRGADFISVEDPSFIGDYVPDFKALYAPMLYRSFDEYVALTRKQVVKDMIGRRREGRASRSWPWITSTASAT